MGSNKNKNGKNNEQFDDIEQLKDNERNLENEDMSSRVRNMLKSDKEAIRRMREQMAKLEEDDELDYLDDEKIDLPVIVNDSNEKVSDNKQTNSEENNEELTRKKSSKATNNNKNINNKNNRKEDNFVKKDEFKEQKDKEDKEVKDVNLDFFENMAREDEKHYNKIRKATPNRLKKNNDANIKEYFTNSVRNMAIVTTIAMLLVIMFIALFTTGKKDKDIKNYNFIEIDETGFVTAINDYYSSLGTGNVDEIRKYIYEGKELSNADILKLTEEQMFLSEFFFSDILEKPFEITDCYVLKGMKKKEYIVLMKYQFTIKDCVEPAVGIFSWYIVDVSMSETPVYKVSTKVGDTSSKIYKYVCDMENTELVIDLVEDVNNELVESCKKDEVLRKIIFNMYDEMVKSGDKIDNSFRKMIVELKEYEENN
ncbi:MAG: hypothetical protein IJA34_03970 [Lachnospiraceae bacterium]|nr:hypothetical protein [Lachnospiraceae bacterium]